MTDIKLFYRVSNQKTQQGLWYDFNGNFTGLIHKEFDFCTNSKLLMPFDSNVIGWLSATASLDDLFNWFTLEDLSKLEQYDYFVYIYEASEYKFHDNHWLIKQDTSIVKERINILTT